MTRSTNMTRSPEGIHRVLFSDLAGVAAPDRVVIDGDEARHIARVRRARAGESVELLDLEGRVGRAAVASVGGGKSRPEIAVDIDRVESVPPVRPEVAVASPPPKGERLERMIDHLTQIGVTRWTPLACDRGARDPGSIRPDRLARIIAEACKQAGRAHALRIDEPRAPEDLAGDPVTTPIVCDASGDAPLAPLDPDAPATLLIGPEGGWSGPERALYASRACPVRRIGAHVLRIEAAAGAAASIALAHARPADPQQSPAGCRSEGDDI